MNGPRFHVRLVPEGRWGGVQALAEAARHAEELGFWGVTLADHSIVPRDHRVPPQADVWYDKFVLASYLAALTQRIRLVFLVLVVPYRPPALTAKLVATLDQVSNGRVTLGIGSGNVKSEFDLLGIPYQERGAITDEYLRAMRVLWTEDAPSFRGKYVSFADATFLPRCLQKPHVPIWVGGNSPAAIRRAVELGSGWAPTTGTLANLERGMERIGRGLAESGRDPGQFEFCCTLAVGPPDPWNPHVVVDETHRPEHRANSLACPYDAPAVIDYIGRLWEAGFNHIYPRFRWDTPAAWMGHMEWFAAKVMPFVRD